MVQDGYGCTCMLGCGLPAVEIHEAQHALMFLWRRIDEDSGGPGCSRGGQGLNYAFAATRRMIGPLYNAVAEVPPSGFGGGLPGAAANCYALRETNVLELLEAGTYPSEAELSGIRVDYRAKEGHIELEPGDVLVTLGTGRGRARRSAAARARARRRRRTRRLLDPGPRPCGLRRRAHRHRAGRGGRNGGASCRRTRRSGLVEHRHGARRAATDTDQASPCRPPAGPAGPAAPHSATPRTTGVA